MRKTCLILMSFMLCSPAAAGSFHVSQETGVTVYRGVEARPSAQTVARLSAKRKAERANKALQADLKRQNRLIADQTQEINSLSAKIDDLESRVESRAQPQRGRYGRRYIGNNRFFGANGFLGNSNFAGAAPLLPRRRGPKH